MQLVWPEVLVRRLPRFDIAAGTAQFARFAVRMFDAGIVPVLVGIAAGIVAGFFAAYLLGLVGDPAYNLAGLVVVGSGLGALAGRWHVHVREVFPDWHWTARFLMSLVMIGGAVALTAFSSSLEQYFPRSSWLDGAVVLASLALIQFIAALHFVRQGRMIERRS